MSQFDKTQLIIFILSVNFGNIKLDVFGFVIFGTSVNEKRKKVIADFPCI